MSDTETTPASVEPDIIGDFLIKYKQDSQEWRNYMEYTQAYLKRVVKQNDIPSLVTGRVKEAAKLEQKLRKQNPFWRYSTEKHILNTLVDLIGLRVSSYFPDDQKRVIKLLEEKFVCVTSVVFKDDKELYETGKTVQDDAGKQIVAYINERYKEASAGFSRSQDPTHNASPRKALRNYHRRFGGYTAEHQWVILRPEQRDAAGRFALIPIEIQIRSVLMDSWIAINHDIEYDALTGVLSTQERRILDSIKGLAQTGEVLLEQLHHVHRERLRTDQVKFQTVEDVSKVLHDYFGIDDPMNGFPKDLFAYLLFSLLPQVELGNPGKLKLHLRDNDISPEFQEEFKRFSANFPMQPSLESYILPPLMRLIPLGQIEDMWNSSRMAKFTFGELMERTLDWIARIGTQDDEFLRFLESDILPSSCGFEGLTFMFCIVAWLDETHERTTATNIWRHGANSILISTYLKTEEGVGPFHIIALVNVWQAKPVLWDEKRVAGVVSRLAKSPTEWERGVNSFLKYSRVVISRIIEERKMDETDASKLERTRENISIKMFDWMAQWCTVDEMLSTAHTRPDASPCSSTQSFWELMANCQREIGIDHSTALVA
jgi:ppGpp synthetase/RelA/SpoT-type nucleotidyltranferase